MAAAWVAADMLAGGALCHKQQRQNGGGVRTYLGWQPFSFCANQLAPPFLLTTPLLYVSSIVHGVMSVGHA